MHYITIAPSPHTQHLHLFISSADVMKRIELRTPTIFITITITTLLLLLKCITTWAQWLFQLTQLYDFNQNGDFVNKNCFKTVKWALSSSSSLSSSILLLSLSSLPSSSYLTTITHTDFIICNILHFFYEQYYFHHILSPYHNTNQIKPLKITPYHTQHFHYCWHSHPQQNQFILSSCHSHLTSYLSHTLSYFIISANGRRFLAEYGRLIKDAYPVSNVQNNNYRTGKYLTLFPFKRMFVVCQI